MRARLFETTYETVDFIGNYSFVAGNVSTAAFFSEATDSTRLRLGGCKSRSGIGNRDKDCYAGNDASAKLVLAKRKARL